MVLALADGVGGNRENGIDASVYSNGLIKAILKKFKS
jgi:hypothetical protein